MIKIQPKQSLNSDLDCYLSDKILGNL